MATYNIDEKQYPRPIRESGKRVFRGAGIGEQVNTGMNGFFANLHERAKTADPLAARRVPVKTVTANTSISLPEYTGPKRAERTTGRPSSVFSNNTTSVNPNQSLAARTGSGGGGSHLSPVSALAKAEAPLNESPLWKRSNTNAGNGNIQRWNSTGKDDGTARTFFTNLSGVNPQNNNGGKLQGRQGVSFNGRTLNSDGSVGSPGQMTVQNMDSWVANRISKNQALTKTNNAEYQRQVDKAQSIRDDSRSPLAKFVSGMQEMRKANRTETREDGQAHEMALANMQAQTAANKTSAPSNYPDNIKLLLSDQVDDGLGNVNSVQSPTKYSSFNKVMQMSGVTDVNELGPVWEQAQQFGVPDEDLAHLIKYKDNPEFIKKFQAKYGDSGYNPFWIENYGVNQ
jgi:hypothetical protein